MATLRDIKRRITSVKSTQQITKARKRAVAFGTSAWGAMVAQGGDERQTDG